MKKPNIDPGELKTLVRKILPDITTIRRTFHEHPETGMEEYNTAEIIRRELKKTEVEILPPYIGTDTVALLYGKKSGKNITLRADIDALPLEDQSDVPWRSVVKGVAHSCGHDGHAAILLGAARVLAGLTSQISGSVRFVFQPAEEKYGGGKAMVAAGLLDAKPKPSAVYALHGWPEIPLGTFSARSGVYMAANARFTVTVKGKGGHGGKPHLTVDPIVTGTRIVQSLQTIVSRMKDPLLPAVVSVCRFQAGTADNVIPETAELAGTVRYFDPGLKAVIPEKMRQIIKGCCDAAGGDFDFTYQDGYIPLVNNPEKTAFVRRVAEQYIGEDAWQEGLPITTSSEDFSFYLNKVPGVFIRLGLGPGCCNLHNPKFDFNDDAIEGGITLLCALVLESLS